MARLKVKRRDKIKYKGEWDKVKGKGEVEGKGTMDKVEGQGKERTGREGRKGGRWISRWSTKVIMKCKGQGEGRRTRWMARVSWIGQGWRLLVKAQEQGRSKKQRKKEIRVNDKDKREGPRQAREKDKGQSEGQREGQWQGERWTTRVKDKEEGKEKGEGKGKGWGTGMKVKVNGQRQGTR